ncbi:hypothetical protein G4P69_23275 [Aetokthonos hydrillicola CCALA 1050]|nr:hypothetical protein [Aetokthonos hydrillicola CCALA 1050]
MQSNTDFPQLAVESPIRRQIAQKIGSPSKFLVSRPWRDVEETGYPY